MLPPDDGPPIARRRQVLESLTFTKQLSALGDIKRLDQVLAAVQLALTENAEIYPVVRGMRTTRLVKTLAVGDIPAFNIWFTIDSDDESVLLYAIEPSPEE